MRKFLEIGGFLAGAILIAFGVGAIIIGIDGRSTVRDNLKQEQIVGSADMTPSAIKQEAMQAGLSPTISLPTVAVAGKSIDTGARARAFASYMRIHALEASGGLVYAQLPRYASSNGKGTNDATLALKDSKGAPVANPVRDTWITATALSTALNVSYMAEQVALFGIVVGLALLLAGIGFVVLAVGGTMRNPEPAFKVGFHRKEKTAAAGAV